MSRLKLEETGRPLSQNLRGGRCTIRDSGKDTDGRLFVLVIPGDGQRCGIRMAFGKILPMQGAFMDVVCVCLKPNSIQHGFGDSIFPEVFIIFC